MSDNNSLGWKTNNKHTKHLVSFLGLFCCCCCCCSTHPITQIKNVRAYRKERKRDILLCILTRLDMLSLLVGRARPSENKFTCTQSCYVYGRRSARRREDNINVGVRCCCCCCSPSAGQHLWVCVRVYIKTHKSAGEKEKRINRRPCHAHSARAAFGYLFLSIDELPLPRSEKNIYCSCQQRCIVSTA